ncbi:aldo/keto reductase [Ornithinicoccus halotolerans]|uniref:aldo/keto reductase n=1 Tax=Ornithinicoccus halotolerans TaxID=1748220 RepID=UPI00129533F4|nr:aldo/keto reductase [Ornithinicoccus halotolerans]
MSAGTPSAGTPARVGLGGAPLGNLYRPLTEEESDATVRTAWELGVRDFDTAPHYGMGLSERRMGRVLAPLLAQHGGEGVSVSTKVGRLLRDNPDYREGDRDPEWFAVPATTRRVWDPTADGVRRSVEESLERLGLDRVDTLYLHDPDQYDLEQGIREGLPALVALREEGLVDRVGVGCNDQDVIARCVRAADLDVVMCAGRYSLLEQPAAADLLPLCLERGVRVVAAGVYNSGALARPVMPAPEELTYDYLAAPPDVVEKVRRLYEVCGAHGVTVPQAAVQFVARHPAVEVVMLGARHPDEIRAGVANATAEIPDALWRDLVDQGLLAQPPLPVGQP